MTEERIFRLENKVADLSEQNAALAVSVQHLSDAVAGLTTTLTALKSTMDKGRGALWVIVAASGLLGGLLSGALNKWVLNS